MNYLDIVHSLAGKTYTLEWDAVVAYDRQKVNHLLQQQYVNKLGAGTHFPPITWENKNRTIRFENITLGTPLISFEHANTENSRASAMLEFIDGNVIEKNSNNQVINYTRIRPGMGLSMKLNIDLTAGEGSVDEKGKVLVNFSKGSITQIDLNLTGELPAEVREYFSRWLLENTVIYELGKLSLKDLNAKLTPKKFIIRTQSAPGAALLSATNYGDGAVLLFIATEYNPSGGTLPTNNYPWLIPEENSSAILINNKIIVEHYIKPSVNKVLIQGKWELIRGNGSNDAFYLKASADANIRTSPVKYYEVEQNITKSIWSGDFTLSGWPVAILESIYQDFLYKFDQSVWVSNEEGYLSLETGNGFKQLISACLSHCKLDGCAYSPGKIDALFSYSGKLVYKFVVDATNKTVNLTLAENTLALKSNVKQVTDVIGGNIDQIFEEKILTVLNNSLDFLNGIVFQDIGIFAVDKLLFPEQNINQIESAYMPGDLIIFGNIDPTLTSLALSPLTSTIAAGDKMAFSTNTKDKVTYTLSPKEAGRITLDGVYYAPDSINEGALNVTVTATTAKGSAAAHITVVSTPVLIFPSFISLREDNLHTIQFNVKILGTDRTFDKWTLSSSNPSFLGTIDRNGVYTPPISDGDEKYPKDYTYVTVTAVASDGKTSQAYIMLVSDQTHPEFKVLPSFTRISPKVSHKFTAKETEDFVPNVWTYYPALGKLSKPENEDALYWVNYTAPDTLSGDGLTIIRAIQKSKPHRAGYSVIDLSNKAPEPWDLVEGVSVLKVVNEAGSGSAKLYKNNAQQAIIQIQFSGYRLDNGQPVSVPITLDNILPHLKLVDYVSGEPLDWEKGQDWYYSTKPNQFQRLPVGMLADSQDNLIQNTDTFTLYVSCNQHSQSSSKRVAVTVKLKDGTYISTATGGNSGFDSSVTLDALPAINYSLAQNITISNDSAVVIENDVSWASHETASTKFVTREDKCEIAMTRFIISPANKQIEKFHSFSIQQDGIVNLDVSNVYFTWDNKVEPVFECLNGQTGKQCAVLGKSKDIAIDGTANVWFFGGAVELNAGPIYFATKEKNILYRVAVPQLKYGKPNMELPYFSLLKISTPRKKPSLLDEFKPLEEVKPYQWKSVIHPLTLSLTDIYGNTGKIEVTWDEENYYDKLHIL